MGQVEKTVFTESYKLVLQQLRQARKEAGLTQEQLAERLRPTLDLPPQEAQLVKWQTQRFVARCETGQRRIDILELRLLCRALGVSYVEFVQKLDSLLD